MKNQLPHPPHATCSYHRQAINIYITTRSNSGWQKSCRVGGHRSSRSSKKKISHSSVHARIPCQIQTHHIVDVHHTYHAPCTTSRVSQAPREAGEVPTNRRRAHRRYVDTTAEQPGDCAASDTSWPHNYCLKYTSLAAGARMHASRNTQHAACSTDTPTAARAAAVGIQTPQICTARGDGDEAQSARPAAEVRHHNPKGLVPVAAAYSQADATETLELSDKAARHPHASLRPLV